MANFIFGNIIKKMMLMIRVLSLDQATITGYSIFEHDNENDDFQLIKYGVYKSNGKIFDNKIVNICDYVEKLIDDFEISLLIIEDVQLQSNVMTFGKLSRLIGGLIELSNKKNIEILIIKPSEWRKGLGIKGKKREELKLNSRKYVLNKYGIDVTDDISDSILIGTYYFEELFSID